jgi:hypothetical protein
VTDLQHEIVSRASSVEARHGVREHRGPATTAGILSLAVGAPIREAADPVVLFPVLRRVNEVLAAGYLVVRGAAETACYVLLAIGWLLVVPLGQALAAGAGTDTPTGVRVGDLVINADATNAVLALVFLLGAVMFYALLYRSRIVPRWSAWWGLVAIPFYLPPAPIPRRHAHQWALTGESGHVGSVG